MATDFGQLRIGEFARRVGVTPELLRELKRVTGRDLTKLAAGQ